MVGKAKLYAVGSRITYVSRRESEFISTGCWLRIKDEVCTNPLCHDLGLTIQVTNKNTNLNQLDDMLNLIIRLPKELREIVGYDDIPLDIKMN